MAKANKTWSIQFSKTGEKFTTLIRFDNREIADAVLKANAGYGSAFGHPYWRIREADLSSKDFNAVISGD